MLLRQGELIHFRDAPEQWEPAHPAYSWGDDLSMTAQPGHAPLTFHALSYLEDGDDVVIGRRDIDSYGVFPPDGAALVQRLAAGVPPDEAAAWYERSYGEPVDLDDMLDTLRELGFLRDSGEETAQGPVKWQRLGRALFSPVAWLVYAALVAGAIAVCLDDHRLIPHHSHVFFTEYLSVVELVLAFGQVPFVLLHEWFHIMAGRRLGLRTGLSLSQRSYFVVFETRMDGLVSVPRRSRYLPMLAGLVADLLVLSALTLLASIDPGSLFGRICLAFAFTTVFRILWQFYFFFRTDIYYLITTVAGCVDLHTATREWLCNRWRDILRRPRRFDETRWHPRDAAVVPVYGVLHVAGYAALLAFMIFVMLPVSWQFVSGAAAGLVSGDLDRFADAVLLLALNLTQPVVAAVLAVRARRSPKESPWPVTSGSKRRTTRPVGRPSPR